MESANGVAGNWIIFKPISQPVISEGLGVANT